MKVTCMQIDRQIGLKNEKGSKIKIACVCIAKNEDSYIQEWVEYNTKLGFDKIILYQNNWRTKFDHPNLIKIEFDENRGDRQVFCYNSFISDFKSDFNFAAFFDVDEFLVLKKHRSVKHFVEEYSEHPCISMKWFYFGDNGLKHIENNDFNVLKRFTKRGVNPDIIGKSIVRIDKNPPLMAVHKPHCLCTDIPVEVAQINHYYSKTKEEFEIKKYNRIDDGVLSDRNYEIANQNEIEDHLAYNFFKN